MHERCEDPSCVVCVVDSFHDWLDERRRKRERLKQERRSMSVEERYDLGGES